MNSNEHTWVILEARPPHLELKSYKETVQRILGQLDGMVSRDRVMIIAHNEDFEALHDLLSEIPCPNILVQPYNLGNALSLLITLLEIERKDRGANVLLLPCYRVRNEGLFFESLTGALRTIGNGCKNALLLGMEPALSENAWKGGGWLVPQFPADKNGFPILSMIAQADADFAQDLRRQGGLYNTKILVAPVSVFLLFFMLSEAEMMRPFLTKSRQKNLVFSVEEAGSDRKLPFRDFFRDILNPNLSFLRIRSIPNCGLSLFAREFQTTADPERQWNFLFRRRSIEFSERSRRMYH